MFGHAVVTILQVVALALSFIFLGIQLFPASCRPWTRTSRANTMIAKLIHTWRHQTHTVDVTVMGRRMHVWTASAAFLSCSRLSIHSVTSYCYLPNLLSLCTWARFAHWSAYRWNPKPPTHSGCHFWYFGCFVRYAVPIHTRRFLKLDIVDREWILDQTSIWRCCCTTRGSRSAGRPRYRHSIRTDWVGD